MNHQVKYTAIITGVAAGFFSAALVTFVDVVRNQPSDYASLALVFAIAQLTTTVVLLSKSKAKA